MVTFGSRVILELRVSFGSRVIFESWVPFGSWITFELRVILGLKVTLGSMVILRLQDYLWVEVAGVLVIVPDLGVVAEGETESGHPLFPLSISSSLCY